MPSDLLIQNYTLFPFAEKDGQETITAMSKTGFHKRQFEDILIDKDCQDQTGEKSMDMKQLLDEELSLISGGYLKEGWEDVTLSMHQHRSQKT